jgi:hypothetical protein
LPVKSTVFFKSLCGSCRINWFQFDTFPPDRLDIQEKIKRAVLSFSDNHKIWFLAQVHAHLGQKAEKVGIFRDGV